MPFSTPSEILLSLTWGDISVTGADSSLVNLSVDSLIVIQIKNWVLITLQAPTHVGVGEHS